ncbi:MAG TPA: hypothetical protein VNT81_12545 [Vicinamibacterales bacterium]|nr:hypothetical protein [Vicinamibacterales bacterium]
MFIGHYALAFGAKKVAPSVSLGTAFIACQFADMLWPIFLGMGLEIVAIEPGNTLVTPLNFISYPYSHSLVMLFVWAALFGLTYFVLARAKSTTAAITVAALVLSHYVLDVITHRPDMPVTIGGATRLGLGLWNYPGATLAVESALFIAGATIYNGVTRAKDRVGTYGLWSLIAVLVAIYFAALYGPPPPSVSAIAGAGHLSWVFVIWAYWVDRHRTAR